MTHANETCVKSVCWKQINRKIRIFEIVKFPDDCKERLLGLPGLLGYLGYLGYEGQDAGSSCGVTSYRLRVTGRPGVLSYLSCLGYWVIRLLELQARNIGTYAPCQKYK